MKALDIKKAHPGQLIMWTSFVSRYALKKYGKLTGLQQKQDGGYSRKSINYFEVQKVEPNEDFTAFIDVEVDPEMMPAGCIARFIEAETTLSSLRENKQAEADSRKRKALERLKSDSIRNSDTSENLFDALQKAFENLGLENVSVLITHGKFPGQTYDNFMNAKFDDLLTVALKIKGADVWPFVKQITRGEIID